MPTIEIWYWDPIFFFNGHVALKLGEYTYNFEVDARPRHERKLVNSKRVFANPLLGGWAGCLNKRTVDQEADIIIDQWIQNRMKWNTNKLFVHVFEFEVSDNEYAATTMFFNNIVENEPEYCFYSPDNSKNCMTFAVDALNKTGITNYNFDFSITHEELQNFGVSIPESTALLFKRFGDKLKTIECDSLKGPWPWIFFVRFMQGIDLTDSKTSKFRGYYRKHLTIKKSFWSLTIFAKIVQAVSFLESKLSIIRRLIKRHIATKNWLKPRIIFLKLIVAIGFVESNIPRIRWLIKKWILYKHEWLIIK